MILLWTDIVVGYLIEEKVQIVLNVLRGTEGMHLSAGRVCICNLCVAAIAGNLVQSTSYVMV